MYFWRTYYWAFLALNLLLFAFEGAQGIVNLVLNIGLLLAVVPLYGYVYKLKVGSPAIAAGFFFFSAVTVLIGLIGITIALAPLGVEYAVLAAGLLALTYTPLLFALFQYGFRSQEIWRGT